MINEYTLITLLSPEYENKAGSIHTTGTATDGSGAKKEIDIRWARGKAGSSLVFWLPDMDPDVIDSRVTAQRASWALKKAAAAGTDTDLNILEAKEAMLNLTVTLLLANIDVDDARYVCIALFSAWLAHHIFGADAVGEEEWTA